MGLGLGLGSGLALCSDHVLERRPAVLFVAEVVRALAGLLVEALQLLDALFTRCLRRLVDLSRLLG